MSAVTVGVGSGRSIAITPGGEGPGEHPLMTVPEAAKALRVSEMTIRRAIHGGEMPFVKIGRAYRVPRSFVTGVLAQADQAASQGGAR
jgi:excisionase family DNA binding protein